MSWHQKKLFLNVSDIFHLFLFWSWSFISSHEQGDQNIEKTAHLLEKTAQTVAEQKKCKIIYIKVQFENICYRALLKH